MKVVAYQELAATPWKNGGGVTRELACHPAGAGFDDFQWRVSIADVHQSGPFSRFPGIDRIIVLLDGGGMRLHQQNGAHDLTEALVPYAFAGETQVDAELVSPSRDFNLMLRRGRASGSIIVCRDSAMLDAAADTRLLYCVSGSWRIAGCELQAGDHVLLAPARAGELAMLRAGALLCVDITPTN